MPVWPLAEGIMPRAPAGTRFHDLRHFYASTLIASTLNPKVKPRSKT